MLVQAYGKELAEAYEWLQKYRLSRKEAELHQAWDLYYHVFKRINKQLPSLVMLELHYVSPALAKAEVGRPTCSQIPISASLPALTSSTPPKPPNSIVCRGGRCAGKRSFRSHHLKISAAFRKGSEVCELGQRNDKRQNGQQGFPSITSLGPSVAVVLQGLELAVPGTYIAGAPVVTIAAFAPQLTVITSKQRPRKLTIHGSDGAEYMFLLKVGLFHPFAFLHHAHLWPSCIF